MSQAAAMEVAAGRAKRSAARARWFYPLAGILVLALVVWGFRHFYLQGRAWPGREITPPIRGLVIAHGIMMALWTLLFALQPLLVAARRVKAHMMLGIFGAVLAAVIVPVGFFFSLSSIRLLPAEARLWSMAPKEFLVVPLAALLGFAACVGIGIWKRKRAEIHRPMMLVGTLSAAGAAISRIDALNQLYVGTVFERLWGPFLMTLVIGWILLGIKCAAERKFDKWMAIGMAGLTAMLTLAIPLAKTAAWDGFARTVL